jgi:ribulose-5-phosphate 4-epimerase/fuculose-1-phosphate aldolase
MSDLSELKVASMRERVSREEWETRVDLAACYRLVHHYGMDDLVYNHISARVPGEEGHFLINAYGMTYDEITASSLVKIDFDGSVVQDSGTGYGINHAGFVIHSAIHRGRPDVACVIHTHTPSGMAVSAMKCGLVPLTQNAMFFSGVGYHDYEGPAVDLDEQRRLVSDLGGHVAMVLRNHGLLPWAPPSPKRSSRSTGSSAPARRRHSRWRVTQNCFTQTKRSSVLPTTDTSPASAARSARSNGPGCCAWWRDGTRACAIDR